MKALWLHVRNSPVRWTLPVFVVLDLAVLFLRSRTWIGVWPETGAAAQLPAYLMGILVAGAAAWAAGAPSRHRLGEQVSASRFPPAVSEGHRLASTIIVLVTPYLTGQIVAFVITARTFPPGVHLFLGYAGLGLFVMLMAVALGWACGLLLDGQVFPALTAVMGFFLLAAALGRTGSIVLTGPPESTVDPIALMLRLGLVTALMLALIWLPATDRDRPSGRKALVAAIAALPLVATVVGTRPVVDREQPGTNVICLDGASKICIWPEHEKYLPQLQKLNARISLLPATFVPPPLINEAGITKTRYIGPDGKEYISYGGGPPIFYIFDGSPWSYADDIGNAINKSTFGFNDDQNCDWQELSQSDQERIWAVDKWMETYLVGDGAPDYQTDASNEMQVAWSKGREIASRARVDQFRWAEQEVRDVRARYCQPGR